MDDDWWADAYHYRAADREEESDGRNEPEDELDGDTRGTPPGTCPSDQATASCPGRCSGHEAG